MTLTHVVKKWTECPVSWKLKVSLSTQSLVMLCRIYLKDWLLIFTRFHDCFALLFHWTVVCALQCVAVVVFYRVKMTHFRLTKQQQELWYAYQLNPKGDNYSIAVSYRVRGNFDKASNTAKLSYTKLRFITYLLYSDRRYTGRVGVRAFKWGYLNWSKKF